MIGAISNSLADLLQNPAYKVILLVLLTTAFERHSRTENSISSRVYT